MLFRLKDKKQARVSLALCLVIFLLGVLIVVSQADNVQAQGRPTLYWGSRGQAVREVQSRLSQWGYYHGGIDGVFGAQTSQAVQLFQRRNGLTVDGIVGSQTYAALGLTGGTPAYTSSSSGVSRSDDIDLLARTVSGEARGEPYTGQVAVAAVILNRVRSSSFPNTLSGVVYQPLAFEAASDGQIWMQPTENAYRAARDALNGWDPTHGCLYFWNPYKQVNPWVWTRQIVTQFGQHVFAR